MIIGIRFWASRLVWFFRQASMRLDYILRDPYDIGHNAALLDKINKHHSEKPTSPKGASL